MMDSANIADQIIVEVATASHGWLRAIGALVR
jgi:hypothetical protein